MREIQKHLNSRKNRKRVDLSRKNIIRTRKVQHGVQAVYDLDLITCAEHGQLGVVWYENLTR